MKKLITILLLVAITDLLFSIYLLKECQFLVQDSVRLLQMANDEFGGTYDYATWKKYHKEGHR